MRRRHHRERGAALVEFALIIPLLTMLLFGIVQFGIAYDKQQSMNSAAREGARLAALEVSTLEDISLRAVGSFRNTAAAGDDPKVIVAPAATPETPSGARCSNGSYRATDDCRNSLSEADPVGDSIDEDDPTEMPCGAASPSDYVVVTASTPHKLTIPFFGAPELTIQSKAEFRCE